MKNSSILSIDRLSYEKENIKILQNINFSVNTGERVMITGPSGSGKSTLLKLIGNVLTKTSGTIQFKGKPIENYASTEYRKQVSYFFQNPVLFGQTVRDNLTFPYEIRNLDFDETRTHQLLNEVQLSNDYLDKDIATLSGGEKQRIAFVRNLLFLPDILLLDEVTSALDEENGQIIRNIISKLNKEEHLTILWVTHDKEEFLSSNRRLTIEDGLLTEDSHE